MGGPGRDLKAMRQPFSLAENEIITVATDDGRPASKSPSSEAA
eukprot:CAMPEP_0172192256 /NCGR_PEP_ID=MMETSP1050-20130122/24213_1 /TAXON_ID=233186 /ORGANISM="Cryptomonas curvata, Strain CCAP979/52" /LENGTH=42 /DNA_ID= /DNA_START= /DNA_END= /DNA_ORIENTATION=